MIEPILLFAAPTKAFFDEHKKNGMNSVFYVQQSPGVLISNFINIKKSGPSNHNNFFATITRSDTHYWFGNELVKKEFWLDMMIREFPEYFEWYLFHPEHLLCDAK